MMNGLRIYVSPGGPKTPEGGEEFYSRRSNGPYYRWWHEKTTAHWQSARMHSDFSARELSVSPWKSVPAELKRSLVEHYQE